MNIKKLINSYPNKKEISKKMSNSVRTGKDVELTINSKKIKLKRIF